MFAPWRSQNSLHKRKDPITGNSFIAFNYGKRKKRWPNFTERLVEICLFLPLSPPYWIQRYHNATQSECAPRLLVSTGALMCIGVPVPLVAFVFIGALVSKGAPVFISALVSIVAFVFRYICVLRCICVHRDTRVHRCTLVLMCTLVHRFTWVQWCTVSTGSLISVDALLPIGALVSTSVSGWASVHGCACKHGLLFYFKQSLNCFCVFERKVQNIKRYLTQNVRVDLRKNVFDRGFFTLFQDPASYEDPDLCPIRFDATIDESVLMCCPVHGFPPPQVSWELPNGTRLETGSTMLHVTVKTENDFGRYRCIARSLEKNALTADITIRKRSKYKLRI